MRKYKSRDSSIQIHKNSRSCGPSSEMNYKGQRRLLLYEQRIHEVVSEHAPMMR